MTLRPGGRGGGRRAADPNRRRRRRAFVLGVAERSWRCWGSVPLYSSSVAEPPLPLEPLLDCELCGRVWTWGDVGSPFAFFAARRLRFVSTTASLLAMRRLVRCVSTRVLCSWRLRSRIAASFHCGVFPASSVMHRERVLRSTVLDGDLSPNKLLGADDGVALGLNVADGLLTRGESGDLRD